VRYRSQKIAGPGNFRAAPTFAAVTADFQPREGRAVSRQQDTKRAAEDAVRQGINEITVKK
jgi:hypothetical protein